MLVLKIKGGGELYNPDGLGILGECVSQDPIRCIWSLVDRSVTGYTW